MLSDGHWLRFTVGGERYALPVEAVARIISLDQLRCLPVAGWAGVVPLPEGTLPMANGGELLGESAARATLGRGLVLRGRLPLGFTADAVTGLTAGTACPLVGRVGLPELAAAALPTADGTAVVLDADRIWRRLRAALEKEDASGGFRLLPLRPARPQPVTANVDRASGEEERSLATNDGVLILEQAALNDGGDRQALETQSSVAVAERGPPSVETPSSARQSMPRLPMQPEVFPGGEVLVFGVGLDLDLAVPLDQLLEVGPVQTCRPLREGPEQLHGLLSWRGRTVPVIELGRRLGRTDAQSRYTIYLAVTGRACEALAVNVTEIAGPALVPAVVPTPLELMVPAEWSRGAARLGQRPLVVLEPSALAVA